MGTTFRKALAVLLAAACLFGSIPSLANETETEAVSEVMTDLPESEDTEQDREELSSEQTVESLTAGDTSLTEAEEQTDSIDTTDTALQTVDPVQTNVSSETSEEMPAEESSPSDTSVQTTDTESSVSDSEKSTETSAKDSAEDSEEEADTSQASDTLKLLLEETSGSESEDNGKRVRISGIGTGDEIRLYFWNFDASGEFSANMDEWEQYLTEPLDTVTVYGMNDALLELPVTLIDGTASSVNAVYTKETNGEEITGIYLSIPLPEGASVDTGIDLVNDSTEEKTTLFIEACIGNDESDKTPVCGLSVTWETADTDGMSDMAVLAISLEEGDSETLEEESESESESAEDAAEEPNDGIMTASDDADAIDVTYLVTGEGTSHDCNMYKSDLYNEEGHWTECSICGKRYDTSSGTFVEDDSILYEHSIVTSGSGLCGTYTISYCTECGYSTSTYIEHQPTDNGTAWTNPYTYYHAKGACSICGNINENEGAYLVEKCYDSDGNPISCTNRKVCAGCGYDYSSEIVSHHSVCTDDGSTYYCEYCGKEIYKQLTTWEVHDADDPLHYTFYGIFYLCDGVSFPGMSVSGATYAGSDDTTGAVTLTEASYASLPSEYYNNADYHTGGYDSGLYLIQYEAYITDGYQGTIDYVRLNCDNWFSVEPSGKMPEYAKTYSMEFHNLTPDVEAPADLTASVQKSTIVAGYYTQMTLTVSCTDNYSDSVEVGVFDKDGNEIIGYCEAAYDGSGFSYTFNLSSAEIEVQEDQDVFIYYKDRFGNLSKKEITLNKYDTKAPVYEESNNATSTEWSRTKTYVATATDYGVGGVQIAFNDESEYMLADASDCLFTKEYALTGDVYGSVIAAVYYQDALGNTRTQFITIYNLDNTAPTITDVAVEINKGTATLEATANDYSTTLGKEGSGVTSYALSSSATTMDGSWQSENSFTVNRDGTYYIWAMDGVGLTAVSQEVLVTGLTYDVSLTKTVSDPSSCFGEDLSGFVFMISGTSNSGETVEQIAATDSSGFAEFTDIPTGVYTLAEIATGDGTDEASIPDWWDTPKEQEVTVAYGETLSFAAQNTYKAGTVQINKNAETQSDSEFNRSDSYYNDTAAGFAFRLYGTSASGKTIEKYAVTGEDGIALFTDIPVGTEYTVTEVSRDEVQAAADEGNTAAATVSGLVTQKLEQYVAVESFPVIVEYDTTTNYTVNNNLKLFRLTVTRMDSWLLEKGAAQAYATMEGAVYGLYHDGLLIAEYTTDADGTFTTDYYPCGDHWYLQEITPSAGYQPDDSQYDIEASPTLYTKRYNDAHLSLSAQTDPDSEPDSGSGTDADPEANPDPGSVPDSEDVIYVDPYTGSVTIKKYDESGNCLSGVSFALTNTDGNAITNTDGELCTAETTGSDGTVTYTGLFPGDYQAMETDTVPGQSLLSEAFQINLPLILTAAEAKQYGNKLDLSKAVAYTSTDGSVSYYFYNLVYEVTNSAVFAIPTTGGTGKTVITLLFGCTLLTIGLLILWQRKYRYWGLLS